MHWETMLARLIRALPQNGAPAEGAEVPTNGDTAGETADAGLLVKQLTEKQTLTAGTAIYPDLGDLGEQGLHGCGFLEEAGDAAAPDARAQRASDWWPRRS